MGRPPSMHIGRDEVLLALDVEFEPTTPGADVAATVRRIETQIRARFPMIRRIYIEAVNLAPSPGNVRMASNAE